MRSELMKNGKPADLLEQGNNAYIKGEFENAVKFYEDAIRLNSNFVDAWNNRGAALYNLKKYKEAIKSYNEAISIIKSYKRFYIRLFIHSKDDDKEEIKKLYLSYSDYLDNRLALLLKNKGLAYLELKKFKEAGRCFREAQELAPGKVPDLTTTLSVSLFRAEQEISLKKTDLLQKTFYFSLATPRVMSSRTTDLLQKTFYFSSILRNFLIYFKNVFFPIEKVIKGLIPIFKRRKDKTYQEIKEKEEEKWLQEATFFERVGWRVAALELYGELSKIYKKELLIDPTNRQTKEKLKICEAAIRRLEV